MIKKTIIIICAYACILYSNVEVENLFAKAAAHYTEGDISEAKKIYRFLIDKGVASSSLYYNMASVYMTENNFPMATVFYERAFSLNPNDADIVNNLKTAYAKTGNIIYAPIGNKSLYKTMLKITLYAFFLSAISSFIILVFSGKKILIISVCISAFIFALYFLLSVYSDDRKEYAIVVKNNSLAKEAKNSESKTASTLKHGEKIIIKEKHDGWYYIEIKKSEKRMNAWIEEALIQKI